MVELRIVGHSIGTTTVKNIDVLGVRLVSRELLCHNASSIWNHLLVSAVVGKRLKLKTPLPHGIDDGRYLQKPVFVRVTGQLESVACSVTLTWKTFLLTLHQQWREFWYPLANTFEHEAS